MAMKKKTEQSDYNPGDLDEAARVLGSGAALVGSGLKTVGKNVFDGYRSIYRRLRPTSESKAQEELLRLQGEVAVLERRRALEKQLAELRKKKENLSGENEMSPARWTENEQFS